MNSSNDLVVLDIDNTLFDWVAYYVPAMEALIECVSHLTKICPDQIMKEAKAIFEAQGSIEYPFVIQELPCLHQRYYGRIEQLLTEIVLPGREAFRHAAKAKLRPYEKVKETIGELKESATLVALTDAPRYVAMWKLNKLGVLHHFDGVYGLPDPKIPICSITGNPKVTPELLRKHLSQENFYFQGRARSFPNDYEKPSIKGLKTVLMDYDLDMEPHRVLWVGDNLNKDVRMGRSLGVRTAWARYGTLINPSVKERLLRFSPEANVRKNVSLSPRCPDSPVPDITLDCFGELRNLSMPKKQRRAL